MTKIYIYCLFDKLDQFLGVYSSLRSVHRDALGICNRGTVPVRIIEVNPETGRPAAAHQCTLTNLRNLFKGQCDLQIKYQSNRDMVKIYKTKLRE